MPDVKVASLLIIRTLMAETGPDVEKHFMDLLTEDEYRQYRLAVCSVWRPVGEVVNICAKAVSILFPKDPDFGLRTIGRRTALDNLNGIYKLFLKITTVPFVLGRIGRLWQTYHNQGRAWAEVAPDGKAANFFVTGYPELPVQMREILCGYVEALVQMTLAREVSVIKIDDDPNRWHWIARWQ